MSDSLSAAAAATALAVPLLYSWAAASAADRLPRLTGKRICLLIAHPDDEAMFFAPTVLALTREGSRNHVKILCLSAGDAAGLGATRRRELVRSGMALGLKSEEDVFVVDSPDFVDSMTATWDRDKIANLLCSAFATASSSPTIDVLITFDEHGVSSHPNHVSLYHGARAFREEQSGEQSGESGESGESAGRVDVYTLRTVGVLRKYAGVLDGLAALGTALAGHGAEDCNGAEDADADADADRSGRPKRLVFANRLFGGGAALGTAWGAMTRAHRSQMVWFRYLWLGFSRYMLVNELWLEE